MESIEAEGIKAALRPITYGERMERDAMIIRFAGNKPEDDAKIPMWTATFTYINLSMHSDVEGIERPRLGDTDKAFQAKFAKFLGLPDDFVQEWIGVYNDFTTPKKALTEEERDDPNG